MAPGITEDKEGEPFIGASGNFLRLMIRQAGFPKDIAFANAVCCFPGRDGKGGDNRPTRTQLATCAPNLQLQLEIIQPRYIFLVGTTALEAMFPEYDIKHVHGKPLYHSTNLTAWTIYHPAAALRNKKYELEIRTDLTNFWTWRRSGEPWPEECYICLREVEHYDQRGFPACELHAMRQAKLPLPE